MRRLALAWSVASIFCGASSVVFAQVGSVKGKVVDSEGQALAEAQVLFDAAGERPVSRAGKTDKKGEYTVLTMQTNGPWKITVKKDGYNDFVADEPVLVPLGQTVDLPAITLWLKGDKRAPRKVSAAEAARLQAEQKAFADLKGLFDRASGLASEIQTAERAGDTETLRAKLDEAEAGYKALIEKNPDLAEAYFNLGIVYERKQQWNDAAAAYLKAAELKPEMLNALESAAVILQNAGQLAKAEEVLGKAVADHPDNTRFKFRLAEVYYNAAKYDAAAEAFRQLQQTDAANPEPVYYLGIMAVAQGKTPEALALLEKYLTLAPLNPEHAATAKGILQELKPKAPVKPKK